MAIHVKHGDLLNETADVIVSTANVNLAMSGGVNGAIRMRCGDGIAYELQDHLRREGKTFVAPGTVVVTSAATLNAKHILHVVSINAFYESSSALVAQTLREVWTRAAALEAKTIAIPALATGYGPLSMAEFAQGLRDSLEGWGDSFDEIRVVLLKHPDVEIVKNILDS